MGRRSTRTTPVQDKVRDRVLSLPRRLRTESADGLAAEWALRLGEQEYLVSVSGRTCAVSEGPASAAATTVITDPKTWLAMDQGLLSGGQAFLEGRLRMVGNVDLAVRLQTLFEPHGRPRRHSDLDQVDVEAGGVRLSTYVMGSGRPLLLLHGLGATKISWLPLLAPLAKHYRLVVPDLPGHGASQKPKADYSPRFHAHTVRLMLDELGISRPSVVGNSLGGRVAIELARRSPRRVRDLALLDPSVPGLRWRYLLGFARIVPAEVGAIPFPLRERWVEAVIRRLFAQPDRLGNESCSLAAVEFIRVHRDPAARMAFLSSLRHIVTERPDVFYRSLHRIKQRTLVLFGEDDRFIPPRLGARLVQHLPNSRLIVLPGVGHVPQFEATEHTLDALLGFLRDGEDGRRPGRTPGRLVAPHRAS